MIPARPATLSVKFYDGRKPIAEAATLLLSGAMAKLIGATLTRDYAAGKLRVSPRIGAAERFVALPDGGQLQCPDSPALDRLPQEGKTEGMVAWLERRWWVALGCLAATVAALAFGYFVGLPAAAEHVAARVPIEYERKLGEQALDWLDSNGLFQQSQLEPEVQQDVAERFTEFTHDLPLAAHYQLEFRAAPAVGPNAFALPGGVVVITDQLIQSSDVPEEALAVLAHEIGHVERHHALRHLLQDSATAVLAATVTSDASSLTLAVSGLPVLLARTKYSRDFEAEADAYGFALLKRHDISPAHFANIMERLRAGGDEEKEIDWSFLSTHPVTAERIAHARAAARQ